jgi:D-aminopeptidase
MNSRFAMAAVLFVGTGAWVWAHTPASRTESEETRVRASELGLRFGRFERGRLNAITDVDGVAVGHSTVQFGEGRLKPGQGPARTGVTVILPTSDDVWKRKVPAGSFVLNGNGEGTGLAWIEESGWLETPIAFTNTLDVGGVQKAIVDWMMVRNPQMGISDDTVLPVVLECDDSALNDIRGHHVKDSHVREALEKARPRAPVEEGAVGAGTGMMSYQFKGGIGTSSRKVEIGGRDYTVGVIMNTNHGDRHTLRLGGVAVGEAITDLMPKFHEDGSVVVVLATDAPVDARVLKRLSKRVMLGLARTGAVAKHSSGDFALAFSTANRIPQQAKDPLVHYRYLADWSVSPLFEAATDAAEEAMINSILAARTTVGRDGNTAYAIPLERLRKILKSQ